MPIGDSIPLVGIRWDDILFVVLAATLLVSALLVVTLRDIIRCGLALIVSFASLAGIYVLLGNPLVAATQVLVYIGAISVLILFAIMLTQTKNAPHAAGLPDPGLVRGRRRDRDRGRDRRHRPGHHLAVRGSAALDRHRGRRPPALPRLRPAVRGRERAAHRGRRRGSTWPGASRSAARGGSVVSNSLDSYLVLSGLLFAIGTFGFLARRNAISMLMSIELMINAVNLTIVAFGAFVPPLNARRGHRPARDRRRGGRGDGGPGDRHRHLPEPKTPLVDEYDSMKE
jgi:uncharacterized MnhB-related membrane protein